MKRTICKLLLLVVLCLLLAVPASAAQQGSLLLTQVSEPVSVFCVADAQGVTTPDFSDIAETLSQGDLTQEMAKKFYHRVQEKELAVTTATADARLEVYFPALDKGWYLVYSMKQPGEFAPFMICVPMQIGNNTVYHIQAEPKHSDPTEPSLPVNPEDPKPNIPQTGAILWPQYLLLALGALAIVAGLVEVYRGREKSYE